VSDRGTRRHSYCKQRTVLYTAILLQLLSGWRGTHSLPAVTCPSDSQLLTMSPRGSSSVVYANGHLMTSRCTGKVDRATYGRPLQILSRKCLAESGGCRWTLGNTPVLVSAVNIQSPFERVVADMSSISTCQGGSAL